MPTATLKLGRFGTLAAAGFVAAALLSGCANEQRTPTHRWVSFDNVSGAEYRVDNNHCTEVVVGNAGQAVFETNTLAYDKYIACMQDRGYSLTAYNSTAP